MKKYILSLLSILSMLSTASVYAAETAYLKSGDVIVCLGDSITAAGVYDGLLQSMLDGKPVTGKGGREKNPDLFDGNSWKNGNGFLVYEIARGLAPSTPHILKIEPVFDDAKAQELKIESLCVAGDKAAVTREE